MEKNYKEMELLDLRKSEQELNDNIDKEKANLNLAEVKMEKDLETMSKDDFDATKADIETSATLIKNLEAELMTCKSAIKAETERRQSQTFNTTKNFNPMNSVEDKVKAMKESQAFMEEYAKSIKGQENNYAQMVKSLSTANNADGLTPNAFGSVIPTYLENQIERAIVDFGGLFNFAKVTTIKGLLQIPVEVSATGAELHEEGTAAPTEEDINLTDVVLSPKMVKKWITWTDEIEMMSAVNLMDYLVTEFTEKILVKAETEMVKGLATGSKGILGITQTNDEAYVKTISANGELSWTNALVAQGKIRPGRNQVKAFMNRETFYSNVATESDTTGRPLFMFDASGMPKYGGLDVEFIDVLPSFEAASETDVVAFIGYQGAFRLNAPNGLVPQFVLDRVSQAEEDKNKLVGKLFLAGRVTKLNSFVTITKGTAPVAK